jgi:hypothetical protein
MKVRGCIGDDNKVSHGDRGGEKGCGGIGRIEMKKYAQRRNTSILFLLNNYLI